MKKYSILFITLCVVSSFSQDMPVRTQEVQHISSIVAEPFSHYCINVPPGYDEGSFDYPVIYYLHGIYGDHTTGLRTIPVLDSLIVNGSMKPSILVCVNATRNNWYTGDAYRFIIDDLIPHIDATYRTLGDDGRVVMGFSMRGIGTFRCAFTDPEMFKAMVSYDGCNSSIVSTLESNLTNVINSGIKIKWYIGEAYPDFFSSALEVHTILDNNNYPHDNTELPGVGHTEVIGYDNGIVKNPVRLSEGFKFLSEHVSPQSITISPESGDYYGAKTVTIEPHLDNAELYYTLDGSLPTPSSTDYDGPFEISDTVTVHAALFASGSGDPRGVPQMAYYPHRTLWNPIAPQAPTLGLDYEVYTGQYEKLPDFTTLSLDLSGTTSNLWLNDVRQPDPFAAILHGYVKVETEGFYQFYINSDDGARRLTCQHVKGRCRSERAECS
ncbi:MAG: hypothetical protein GF401_00655 [Chitinivibrionales bacterium]|nr:hypothetical protein [Chitinivibrionales bacterium]